MFYPEACKGLLTKSKAPFFASITAVFLINKDISGNTIYYTRKTFCLFKIY